MAKHGIEGRRGGVWLVSGGGGLIGISIRRGLLGFEMAAVL